jgi:integrase
MAITVQDRNGTYGRKRKAEGPPLDKRSARYFAVVNNVWSKGATTRRAAELVERKMKADAERGVSLSGSALTLQQFFDTVWWPSVDARQKRGDIAIGTALHYKIVADSYILPTLGAKRLRHLRAADLRTLYAGLREREKPLSARTIQATHRVASMILVFALDDGYIVSNPARGRDVAPKARSTAPERDGVWDAAQIKSFLEVVADDRLFALWRLAATTGMRRGELLALRWSALDLTTGRAHVERSFVLGPDHVVRYTSPKTARGRRTIDLDAATVKALKLHRKQQAQERLASLGAWPEEGEDADLVFTDEVGRPLFPRTVTMRFAVIIKDAELPKVRLHDLRHSVATLMLRAGVPVHVVSEHLGHASPSITMDVYAHVLRDQRTDATAKLAAAIDGT